MVWSSHPIACDGCLNLNLLKFLARAVAGGESQLSVVIANQLLPDFSEVGSIRSSYLEVNRKGVLAYPSVWLLLTLSDSAGKFVIRGSYSVFNEPSPTHVLTVTDVGGEGSFFTFNL